MNISWGNRELLAGCFEYVGESRIIKFPINNYILPKNPTLFLRTLQFEQFRTRYFESEKSKASGIPTVRYCAEQMNLSPNYLSDLLKKETCKRTQEYIHYY